MEGVQETASKIGRKVTRQCPAHRQCSVSLVRTYLTDF